MPRLHRVRGVDADAQVSRLGIIRDQDVPTLRCGKHPDGPVDGAEDVFIVPAVDQDLAADHKPVELGRIDVAHEEGCVAPSGFYRGLPVRQSLLETLLDDLEVMTALDFVVVVFHGAETIHHRLCVKADGAVTAIPWRERALLRPSELAPVSRRSR